MRTVQPGQQFSKDPRARVTRTVDWSDRLGQSILLNAGSLTVTVAPRVIDELQRRFELLEQRLAAMESCGPRDVQDAVLLGTIAMEIGSREFTAAQLWRHREYAPALAAALREADLESPRELGCWLRCLSTRGAVEGRRLVRCKRAGDGYRWRVQVCT